MVEALYNVAGHSHDRSLLDVPLYAQMAAEAFEAQAATALRTRRRLLPKSRITVHELYRRFVDKKRDLYKERYGFNDPNFLNRPFADNFDSLHQNCAMFLLVSDGAYGNIDSHPFRDYLERNKHYLIKEKTGILWLREDGIPHFVHYTFVEFFAASWMFSQAQNISDVGRTFWSTLLSEATGVGVRQILEQMLVEGLPLHEAVLEGDEQALGAALETRDPNEVDSFGRLALHLAASLGRADAVGALLAKDCDLQRRDSLLGWRPLRYCNSPHQLLAAERLLQAGADCADLVLNDIEAAEARAAQWNLEKFMKFIWESTRSISNIYMQDLAKQTGNDLAKQMGKGVHDLAKQTEKGTNKFFSDAGRGIGNNLRKLRF